jgi:hypothetical protein
VTLIGSFVMGDSMTRRMASARSLSFDTTTADSYLSNQASLGRWTAEFFFGSYDIFKAFAAGRLGERSRYFMAQRMPLIHLYLGDVAFNGSDVGSLTDRLVLILGGC